MKRVSGKEESKVKEIQISSNIDYIFEMQRPKSCKNIFQGESNSVCIESRPSTTPSLHSPAHTLVRTVNLLLDTQFQQFIHKQTRTQTQTQINSV